MTTGKINYSPDYKAQEVYPQPSATKPHPTVFVPVESERSRLEREVIEAAKKHLAANDAPSTFESVANQMSATRELRAATRALLEFEQKQK